MWTGLYWAVVAVATVGFGADVAEVFSRRERDRFYQEAAVIYGIGVSLWLGLEMLVVVLARALDPHTHLWAGAPTAIIAGAAIVFFGGHVIGCSWDAAWQRDRGPKPVLEGHLTPEQLAVAEAYDDEWQTRYRVEHRARPRFEEWHKEYLKKRTVRSR
jgi:hypothetical protein